MSKVTDDGSSHADALEEYGRAYDLMRDNIQRAYDDMGFANGENHWTDTDIAARNAGGVRPALTFNKVMSFVRQATNDMRQMRPAIKVVPVDNDDDVEKAELITGLIRSIEEKSNARQIYAEAVDSQVISGFGGWRVNTRANRLDPKLKDVVIEPLGDQIMVIWDADSRLLSRKDAEHCFVVTDYTPARFRKLWPDGGEADIPDSTPDFGDNWTNGDLIRVAQYWRITRGKDGKAKVAWRTMSGAGWLDDWHDWAGSMIPVVSIYGQVLRIGKRVSIKGMVADIKDAQRAYNYGRSTEVEVVALQPKAPYMGTHKNFLDNQDDWDTANVVNHPFLSYTPDPENAGRAPQRIPPPVASQGILESIAAASEDMKAITGIYDASLGARSNETSGVAIKARQLEGDVGTYHFMENFTIGVGISGEIIVDLIPHVYDTERAERILGEDGKAKTVKINRQPALLIDGEPMDEDDPIDLTVGEYDLVTSMGPSYSTRREAARDMMLEVLKIDKGLATLMLDQVVDMMDMPIGDKIKKRLFTMLPPQIQAMEAADNPDQPPPPQMPPPPPDPAEMMKLEGQKMSLEGDRVASEAKVMGATIDLQIKELSLAVAEADASAKIAAIVAGGTGMVDPAKMEALEQAVAMLASHMGERELQEMGDGYLPDPEPEPVEEPKPQGDPNLMKMLESMTAGQDALAKAMLKPKRVSMTRQPDGSLTGRAEVDEPVIAPEQLPVQPVQP